MVRISAANGDTARGAADGWPDAVEQGDVGATPYMNSLVYLSRQTLSGMVLVGRFTRFSVRRFLGDRCLDQAAALSFTTLLSVVPLVALSMVVVSVVPQFQDLRDDIERLLTANLLPEASTTALTQFRRFVEKAGGLTGFSVVGLAFSAALLLVAVDMAFDVIWRVHRTRPILVRLIAYAAFLVLGPLLIGGTLSLQGHLLTTGKQLAGAAFIKNIRAAGPTILILVEMLGLLLLYRFVPTARVRWSDAFAGAVVGAALLEIVKRGFIHYLKQFSNYHFVYGALAVIPVFLIWLYACWMAVLFAAEVVAALPEWRAARNHGPSGPAGAGLPATRSPPANE